MRDAEPLIKKATIALLPTSSPGHWQAPLSVDHFRAHGELLRLNVSACSTENIDAGDRLEMLFGF